MDYQEHLAIGFISALLIAIITHFALGWFPLQLKLLLLVLITIYIYSLLPDLDHPISTVTWNFIGASIVIMVAGFLSRVPSMSSFIPLGSNLVWIGLGLLILTFALAQFAGHRGWVHSILAGLLFSAPLYFLAGFPLVVIGFVSFYSHLCADDLWTKIY